ncbi:Aste57867_24773 [Aphanomyces stellatus]|uniref:Aste57867_24773 protein n=1 Tax=Aphanomyces stellatus TaxID=120398 RepID=A0A485LRE3_9STRA|nr:hypothetical protein As57867_024695 [Aphanomyces stellatus]VFU01409.1 Aste57867_24773 [Aphanomyces stellatus]
MYLAPLNYDVAALATVAIRSLNLSFVLHGKQSPTAPLLQLMELNVLDQTDFAFFAWLFLIDWASMLEHFRRLASASVANRNAVAFAGDHGVLTVLTEYLPSLAQPSI